MNFNDRLRKFLTATWNYIKVARRELIILAAVLAFDLIVKGIIQATMYVGQSVEVIPNFFNITYVLNKNAAFGSNFGLDKILGETGIRVVFLIITVLAVGFFSVFLYKWRSKHLLGRVGIALIIAGALGNFFDRLFLGYVRDFAQIIFFGLDLPLVGSSFAIFNIADVALVVGVVIFLVFFIFFFEDKKDKEGAKKDSDDKTEFELIDEAQSQEAGGIDTDVQASVKDENSEKQTVSAINGESVAAENANVE